MSERHSLPKLTLVAGPCAAETPEQIRVSMDAALQRGVDFMRISLWKPRTKPGFDGMKEEGIPLLAEAAERGLNPGTEILVASQAEAVLNGVLPSLPDNGRLMLWIGARNQNHLVQQEIARVASRDPRVCLMLKNQPWSSESHWEGIAAHALEGGISAENVYLCHRGFTPHPEDTRGLRNVPDSSMAMRLRTKTNMPMLLDISHIAGAVDKLQAVAMEAVHHAYDGMVIEVHPNPRAAWTDASQQITWAELDQMMDILNRERELKAAAAKASIVSVTQSDSAASSSPSERQPLINLELAAAPV